MAIDTMQKRMSAMCPMCPWRGPLVDATEASFTQGNRQAANLAYSGVLAQAPAAFRPAWASGSNIVITSGQP